MYLMTGLVSGIFLFLIEPFPTILAQGNYDSEGSLRVTGGKDVNEGLLEIYHLGTWGTVCFTEWDMVDGLVACRQLGYPGVDMVGLASGQGTGKIWLNTVRCSGIEKRLDECHHGIWDTNDCDHADDAGVRCALFPEGNQTLRLVDGETDNEGRLELFLNNEWGTVCDDEFDIDDGEVACRQLGYPGVHSVYGEASFGRGYGSIWLDDMQCSGTELTLTDCLRGISDHHDCLHTEDVGVRCLARSGDMSVRLVDGPSDKVGRLEVFHDHQWGTVCDDGWDALDTRVVCQQLGFTENGAYFMAADHGYGTSTGESSAIFLDTVECIGEEERLEHCTHDGWGVHDCQHSEDIGIECYVKGSGPSVGVMVGIGVGCLVGVLLLCLCCLKCNKRTPSQHRAVPTEDVPSPGAVPLGDVHVPREGTPEQNNIHPVMDAVGLPPPSYDEIRNYKSVGLEGISPSGENPNQSLYPLPSAPYPQTHLPPPAPHPQPSAPYPQTHLPHPAPHPQPSAPYPPPSGASGTYYYPAADSGVVPSSPLESYPNNAPYSTRNCTSV
ncbi:soluble scavenger receptor cysteine-rich domain-containing protein SSC5D-like isoform X2 [Lytechinus pictus]|uniref:soluble scavenger receptor cysteine-rich domain-containing protein SSC5D-like isoform X2 n=1 Tax=Lytechinus pictus TaxID=7653 RepID=UPI0030B9E3DB